MSKIRIIRLSVEENIMSGMYPMDSFLLLSRFGRLSPKSEAPLIIIILRSQNSLHITGPDPVRGL